MVDQLTPGAIEAILTGQQLSSPVLQVLGYKKIPGNQSADRYRLLLSDGQYTHSSAMLATQLNEKVDGGELGQFAVIQLNKYLCNKIAEDRRVIIILELDVLQKGNVVNAKLGNPVTYKVGGQNTNPAPPQPAKSNSIQPPKPDISSSMNNNTAKPRQTSLQAPPTPGGTPQRIHPISSLTPYQNRWTIKVRVSHKSAIRTWSNSRGEGKLFSVNLLDDSGEIRATLFKDQVDKFHDLIQVNKVYYISKAQLKTANKQYSSVDNDYEMTFNNDTQVTPCDDDQDMPSVSYNFQAISKLTEIQCPSTVDVIGVVQGIDDVKIIIGKQSNKEIPKRDVQLVDDNGYTVRATLWGGDAESFNHEGHPVMAIKNAKLSDWGGRSISIAGDSSVVIDPDIPDAHRLRGWYDSVGHQMSFQAQSGDGSGSAGGGSNTNWKSFSQVREEKLGHGEKPDYYTVKGTILRIKKENCMYMACPSSDCNKKVIDQGNGSYRCEKCAREYPDFKYRMILQVHLVDATDHLWATCFQESAEGILGKTAADLGALRESNEAQFDQVFSDAMFTSYIMKLRSKTETYNDEARLKTICVNASPLDLREYNNRLISEINKMLES